MPGFTTVEDIMVRDVAYASLPGSRDEVLEILKNKHVSGVPVVKKDELVGIVTRTDLLKYPEEEQLAILMRRDPITIKPGESIVDAARTILEHKVRRLPVVENSTLVGLITIADIVGAIAGLSISEPIGDIISDQTIVIWDKTPVSVVGMIMEMAEVKAAPVVNVNREVLGVINDKDLINISVIEDSLGHSDMSAGSDDDAWTWESMRDTMSLYYSVSRIKLPDSTVSEVINLKGEPVTVVPNTTVSDAARKMKRNNIDQMPVLSGRNKLIGMLHDFDLLKALV
ncbi:MAG: CBS domain-containing protein [Methanosarcinales archaeon]|nr:CBS domain-containing protein [ANME-2 cluster archaeon]MDF1531252.1 CBS domain-containing protein [ANME-2 cluster archaeon]MDW7776110.1 CBS domain-containing protein [Methanosarcinales archaeon]